MRISLSVLAAGVALCIGLPAAAQNFGVLQSAETMDPGVYKLMVAPIVTLDKDGAGGEFGVAARGGYGFTDRFDAEAKLGFFENSTYVGADGEFWILKGKEKDAGLDFSLTGGVHWAFGKKRQPRHHGARCHAALERARDGEAWSCAARWMSRSRRSRTRRRVSDDTFTKRACRTGA